MGLVFTDIEAEQLQTLETWLCRISRDLLARRKPPKESASIDDNPSPSSGAGRRWIAV